MLTRHWGLGTETRRLCSHRHHPASPRPLDSRLRVTSTVFAAPLGSHVHAAGPRPLHFPSRGTCWLQFHREGKYRLYRDEVGALAALRALVPPSECWPGALGTAALSEGVPSETGAGTPHCFKEGGGPYPRRTEGAVSLTKKLSVLHSDTSLWPSPLNFGLSNMPLWKTSISK